MNYLRFVKKYSLMNFDNVKFNLELDCSNLKKPGALRFINLRQTNITGQYTSFL